MMIFAVAIAALIGLAIFSLSKLGPGGALMGSLRDPVITDTLRQPLPAFQHEELAKALNNLSGDGKWTLLTFWSVTCPPCLEELPSLNALAQSWQGPAFQIVTVNFDGDVPEDLENAKRLMQENEIVLPTVYDRNKALKTAFQVNEYPKHFLVSPSKEVVWQQIGAFNWNSAKTRDQLAKLMAVRAPESSEDPAE